ncbi:hypothetical protein AGABI2DRAFT_193141, partial [Agaricus bisporus var. bisporus H97]|uniref:hypothetical protein n=1 Tax=Agaricus bisporus var. bisporus (strain H97 / ATCC MYA-4626 / FGSC 10389) TaxID=936046 RepID=UPI00029F66DF
MKSPGTGRRNRAQRLLEYSERRAAVLGLQRLAAAPRLAGRKRRRNWDPYPPTRRLPNATVLNMIPELGEDDMAEDERPEPPMEPERREEAQLMGVRTITFGTGLAGDMRLGYKYQPDVLKDILFPAPSPNMSDGPPPRKRRRTTIVSEDILMDVDSAESEPPAPTPNRPVILETPKESYLLSLAHGSEFSPEGRQYDISLILEGEVEEDREDAVVLHVADKNAMKAAQEVPPPTPPPDDEPEESKSVPAESAASNAMDDRDDYTKPTNDETREKPLDAIQDATRPPLPSTAVTKADTGPSPPRSSEDVSASNKDTVTTKTQGDK